MQLKNTQKGFTLVEILVSVLILAIGLLGLASLQLFSLQQNVSANNRSVATMKAFEIADKMMANSNSLNSYVVSAGAPASASACSSDCSPASMAAYDLAEWKCSLGRWNEEGACTDLGITGPLPLGDGTITSDGNNFFTITITWDDEKDGTADDSFTMQFIPSNNGL